mmetsp:Transcript_2816/g.3889  ORF Transcript_2816/g.3889 Transcript_2816/m.3889 type:complete len:351 (+) Transcript_2816:24-1076(+)
MAAQSLHQGIPSITATLLESSFAQLGECPIWDIASQSILWVDIEGKKFFKRGWGEESTSTFDLPERPGCFCLCEDGRMIFAFENGPAFYDPIVGFNSLERIAQWEQIPSKNGTGIATRMNDGRVDPMGRLVVGGYDDEPPTDGSPPRSAIYRLDPSKMELELLVPNVQCANSICFSPSGDSMYFTDSMYNPRGIFRSNNYHKLKENEILDMKSNVETDENTKVETFIEWTEQEMRSGLFDLALPDGAVVDAEGRVWSALFGLGKIARYDAQGKIDFIIEVPDVKYVTCLAFGGPDLRSVFITNGEPLLYHKLGKTLSEDQRGSSGGLFVATLPDNIGGGLPEAKFGQKKP